MSSTGPTRKRTSEPAATPEFDVAAFLDSVGASRVIAKHASGAVIFTQGEPATEVMYIQRGSVKLCVRSKTGKEAVVGMLGDGDFFGEACLAGQKLRTSTATAMLATTLLVVEKARMVQMLHKEPTLSDRFLAHMLARNIRIEEDLVDQLFNSSEKRLARALLLMACYGKEETATEPERVLHNLSQDTI